MSSTSNKRWTSASINFLTQDEMRRLLDVIPSKRDYAIILLGGDAGEHRQRHLAGDLPAARIESPSH